MTHLQAAAMRQRAANYMHEKHRGNLPKHIMSEDGNSILALPLDATRAELLAEAVKLPEIAALIAEAKSFLSTGKYWELDTFYAAIEALETP